MESKSAYKYIIICHNPLTYLFRVYSPVSDLAFGQTQRAAKAHYILNLKAQSWFHISNFDLSWEVYTYTGSQSLILTYISFGLNVM